MLRRHGRHNQHGIGIDKCRKHDSAANIDFEGPARLGQVLDPPGGSRFPDYSVMDEKRAVLNYVQFSECGPSPGTSRAVQREQLARPADQRPAIAGRGIRYFFYQIR